MPKTGTRESTSRFALSMAYVSTAGSPGPLLRNTPSGEPASTSDAGVAKEAIRDEIVRERRFRTPVAGDRRFFADDKAGHLRRARLDVIGRHAVIADFRARHRDDLAGIRRIRQDLLIPGHARVED